jgi:hypothetical protein
MSSKPNHSLLIKVLFIGVMIALLSYLFHPGVGQFNLSINGEPVAEPLVRFAAFPSLFLILLLTGFLMLLLFFGVGIMMFIIALLVSLSLGAFLLPYFWPMFVIIFLMIALMSMGAGNNK